MGTTVILELGSTGDQGGNLLVTRLLYSSTLFGLSFFHFFPFYGLCESVYSYGM